MTTGVHVSLSLLVSSVCMPSSGIAGSELPYDPVGRFFIVWATREVGMAQKDLPNVEAYWFAQICFPELERKD